MSDGIRLIGGCVLTLGGVLFLFGSYKWRQRGLWGWPLFFGYAIMFATMGIGLLVAKEHPDWRNVLYTVGALAIAIPVVGWVGRALAIRVRGKP